jgi:hypothetical protein
MQPGTVYRGTPPSRDRLLLGALAFVAIAVLVGAGFFVYGLSTPDDKGVQAAAPPAATRSASASPRLAELPGSGPQTLHVKHSSLCLDTTPNVDPQGAPAIQSACSAAPTGRWTATAVHGAATPETYTLIDAASGKCLDVNGESKDDGAAVVQWTCVGSANQQWTLLPAEGGGSLLVSVNSGKCAGVADAAPAAGAAIVQLTCAGTANQTWFWSGLG